MTEKSETPIQRAAREEIEELDEELEEMRERLPSMDPMELEGDELKLCMEYDRKAFERDQLEKLLDGGLP